LFFEFVSLDGGLAKKTWRERRKAILYYIILHTEPDSMYATNPFHVLRSVEGGLWQDSIYSRLNFSNTRCMKTTDSFVIHCATMLPRRLFFQNKPHDNWL